MEVVVDMACVKIGLVNHGTVRTQPFLAGLGYHADNGFHLLQDIRVA